MYYSRYSSKSSLWQPPQLDLWTPVHLGLAVLAMLAAKVMWIALLVWLTPHRQIPGYLIDPLAMGSAILLWWLGAAYEHAQATADGSQEGIDPLDIAANTAGIILGAKIWWWW